MRRYTDYLAEVLSRQTGVIHMHVDDLTLADTLVQPVGGNNLNWLLGHIAAHREKMLAAAAIAIPWTPGAYTRYDRGSAPLTDSAEATDIVQALADLDAASTLLIAWLKQVDDATLAQQPEGARRDLGGQLGFLIWHEGYHMGQFEQLRHIAGHHNSII